MWGYALCIPRPQKSKHKVAPLPFQIYIFATSAKPARNQKSLETPAQIFFCPKIFVRRADCHHYWRQKISPSEGENFVAKILVRVANFLPNLSCIDNSSNTRKTTLKAANLRKYALSQVLTPALLCVIMQKMQV